MPVSSRNGLRFGECWFDEKPERSGVDILSYVQSPVVPNGAKCTEFHTIITDRSKEPDALMNEIGKNARYKIHRAESKDNLTCE